MSDEQTTPPADSPSPAPTVRLEWGPDVVGDYELDQAAAGVPTAKPDAELAFVKVDPATGEVYLDLPPHDPAAVNAPDRVYLVLYAPGVAIHPTPADAIASDQLQSETDVPPSPDGATIVLPRPEGTKPATKYRAKTVVQFPA
jgi:hypothetical protein